MKIKIISMGNKMPRWVIDPCEDYLKRLPADFSVELIELPLLKRQSKQQLAAILQKEAQSMLKQINPSDRVIALDVEGKTYSTETFADTLAKWQDQTLVFLIGGPEGLHPDCLTRADHKISLSAMTLPHPIARLVFIEQIYRAWSILANHPYHRA